MRRIGSAARNAERKSVMTLQTMLSLNIRFSQSINEMPWIQPIQGVVDEIRRSNRKSPQLIGPALLLQDVIADLATISSKSFRMPKKRFQAEDLEDDPMTIETRMSGMDVVGDMVTWGAHSFYRRTSSLHVIRHF